jgi:hypothetical protein
MEIINNILNDIFWNKKEIKNELKNKNYENYINNKFNNIEIMKCIFQFHNSNLCGFYTLFFARNYINYIKNKNDIYFLEKNLSRYKFYKFYFKIIKYLIENKKNFDEYDINEIKNGGSLERHHMDFILKNYYLFLNNNNNNIKFECARFDYIEQNFILNNCENFQKIQNIFLNIKNNNNNTNNNEIYLFFIGMNDHWIVLIYNKNYNKKKLLLFQSNSLSTFELLNLKKSEINKFINEHELQNQNLFKLKAYTNYEKKNFNNYINNFQELINDINFLLFNENCLNDKNYLIIFILEKYTKKIIESYNENVNINNKNNMEILLQIYNWLLNNYYPTIFIDNIYKVLIFFKITNLEKNLKEFYFFCKNNYNIINTNINLISSIEDINKILKLFLDFTNKIINI